MKDRGKGGRYIIESRRDGSPRKVTEGSCYRTSTSPMVYHVEIKRNLLFPEARERFDCESDDTAVG